MREVLTPRKLKMKKLSGNLHGRKLKMAEILTQEQLIKFVHISNVSPVIYLNGLKTNKGEKCQLNIKAIRIVEIMRIDYIRNKKKEYRISEHIAKDERKQVCKYKIHCSIMQAIWI